MPLPNGLDSGGHTAGTTTPAAEKGPPCQGEENRVGWMTPTDVLSVVQGPSGTSGISSRGCPRRMRWPRQKSQDRRRSSSALTPPTDTPKRVRAAEPTAQRPGAANPVRAEHRAPKEGRQEARDERPSTSKAAAAAEPTARESTSSALTEPRTSYAAVASKVKVAVLPVDYPQVTLSHGELSALEEAILDQVILTGWDTAVSFVFIHFRVGHLVIDCTDQNSADWLLTVAPKLHTWKGVPLDCRIGDDIPSPHTITTKQ
ncbi:hypothetical protein ACLKA6_018228 [Drosophila palustris]